MTTPSNYTSTIASVTTSSAEMVAANPNRKALILYNQGTADVKWYLEDNTTHFYVLSADTGIHIPEAPRNQIKAQTASGTATVTVMEA